MFRSSLSPLIHAYVRQYQIPNTPPPVTLYPAGWRRRWQWLGGEIGGGGEGEIEEGGEGGGGGDWVAKLVVVEKAKLEKAVREAVARLGGKAATATRDDEVVKARLERQPEMTRHLAKLGQLGFDGEAATLRRRGGKAATATLRRRGGKAATVTLRWRGGDAATAR
ncbi:hypothetical protein Droror1_Dr00022308 [Drosera rotundifolia]